MKFRLLYAFFAFFLSFTFFSIVWFGATCPKVIAGCGEPKFDFNYVPVVSIIISVFILFIDPAKVKKFFSQKGKY